MKIFSILAMLLLATGIFVPGFFAMPAFGEDAVKLQELLRIIEVQQKQLEAQQRQLGAQQSQIKAQQKKLEAQEKQFDAQAQLLQQLQSQIKSLGEEVTAADTKTVVKAPPDKVVASKGGDRVNLSISGHVNRAVNIVDDGKDTDAYYVDNDNSESRVRFDGSLKPTEDVTLGSTIELSIAPNKAGLVNQEDQETNNLFDQRITEVYLESQRFGKFSLGKGHTATYGTASVDLSGTGVISYAEISDTAGGILFRQSDDDALTDVRILDAFRAYNGLSRQNRLRYDTPTFHGFRLAGSFISDQRYDAALRWTGQSHGFKAAGAAGVADTNQVDANYQYSGSFSLLHEDTGLNLTLSGGLLERDNQSDPKNFYAKLGWRKRLFSIGETAFGLDYTRSQNLPTDTDDGYSVGASAVQRFEKLGTELYFLYRLHSLDRDAAPNVQDIHVGSFGARIKF
jgi:hypothetical protein